MIASTGWMSRRQAAAYAGVSVETIDNWRKAGVGGFTLPSVKKGRRVLIAVGDLELFLRGGNSWGLPASRRLPAA